jgi:uncharacterized membrane protein
MDPFLLVETLHIISAAVLFGTGLGTAFFMFRSRYAQALEARLQAARTTVLADHLFTAPAVIVQPATGAFLVWQAGYGWTETWLVWTYGLYVLAGACWLPVVAIQIRLKRMLAHSLATGEPLPAAYDRLLQVWFVLGWPAFLGLLVIFSLMVAKPA